MNVLSIKLAPTMGGSTNVLEKTAKEKTVKAAQYGEAVATGIRRPAQREGN